MGLGGNSHFPFWFQAVFLPHFDDSKRWLELRSLHSFVHRKHYHIFPKTAPHHVTHTQEKDLEKAATMIKTMFSPPCDTGCDKQSNAESVEK